MATISSLSTSHPALWMVVNMAIALLLGWCVGYERYFSGRAAGSQVYCLVCATSCAIALLAGYPSLWYWGTAHEVTSDPTKVIGAILTGIGFLGAGIIVQSGLNVRGLTTSASIWGSSAIGILVGVGFYGAAAGLTGLFVVCLAVVPRIEHRLPAHAAIVASLRFREGYRPRQPQVHAFLVARGLRVPMDSLTIRFDNGHFEVQCLIFASAASRTHSMQRIADELSDIPDVVGFSVTHSSRA